jgi:pimeloyl-ACP methyl ester carboxylesterase
MDATLFLVVVIVMVGPVLVSFLMEAMRTEPDPPAALSWAPDLPIQYLLVEGLRLRYIRTGEGPPLVLLHTLGTQLDLFQKLIPELARTFTVYALDYPGHGWSDIPATDYTPAFFVAIIGKFLEEQRIEHATVAGVSIGGTIPLLLAAQRHPGVARVVAINPYDYAKGRGITRANRVAWLVFTLARIPVLGETVMRFRTPWVGRRIMEGGVAEKALPEAFLRESSAVSNRRGHYRAFLSLIRHAHLWEEARSDYSQIAVPVLVVYGDQDWSRESERRATVERIPGAKLKVIEHGGHFLSLDRPQEVIQLLRAFTKVGA